MAATTQKEYSLYNAKGELMAVVMIQATGVSAADISQAQYAAGVPQEYVDAVKNSAHQPTSIVKR